MDSKILADIFNRLQIEQWPDTGNWAYAPTGEKYWTVCSQGIKREGDRPKLYPTMATAIAAFEDAVRAIARTVNKDHGKMTVYWRHMPEIKFFDGSQPGLGGKPAGDIGWTVYSRFLISSMPVIQSADFNQLPED